MGGQSIPLQELAYNIHFFYIQEIFDFADIFVSHENESKSSFESLRNEKIRGKWNKILLVVTLDRQYLFLSFLSARITWPPALPK